MTTATKARSGWQALARTDGTEGHNLEISQDGGYLVLRAKLDSKAVPSKNGKPLFATSRGFASFNGYGISINIMDKRG